jgi:hypothetical protein
MKSFALLISTFVVCTVFSSCNSDRKPAHASTPAVGAAGAATAAKADTFNLVGS